MLGSSVPAWAELAAKKTARATLVPGVVVDLNNPPPETKEADKSAPAWAELAKQKTGISVAIVDC